MEFFSISARKPLVFLHIPKTAGMSMRLYLANQYHPQEICPAQEWSALAQLNPAEIASFKLFRGHFRNNVRGGLPPGTRALAMLRDPIQRTISGLQHMARDPNFHPDHAMVKGKQVFEMLRMRPIMEHQRDVQTAYLSATASFEETRSAVRNASGRGGLRAADVVGNHPDLDVARQTLEETEFVGMLENLPGILRVLTAAMDYHPVASFPEMNENPNHRRPELNDDDYAILNEYNQNDLILYEEAKAVIARRERAVALALLRERGVYRTPQGSFRLDLGDIIPGSGWFDPEETETGHLRWTGPSRHFSLDLPLRADASYKVTLRFGRPEASAGHDIGVLANDVPMETSFEGDRDGGTLIFTVPQRLLATNDGICEFVFDPGPTVQPSQYGGTDLRKLGVVVFGLEFERV